jgi:hypothetical protein
MNFSELFEAVNSSMTGYLNIQGLAKLLPDINDAENFENAMNKLRLGKGNELILEEKMQLALAFISLIGLDPGQKSRVMRVIMSIQDKPSAVQPQAPAQKGSSELSA